MPHINKTVGWHSPLVEQLICNLRSLFESVPQPKKDYMRKLVVADDVLKSNPDVSKFELVLIASKMHRMGLRPTLKECMLALQHNEVDPKDILKEIVSPTKPKEEDEEVEIRGSEQVQNMVEKE